ncbi:MAG: ImmA/IrrE family metallo-endopeptidase [Muribaculaceae bacterium]|nr:ImmA/IrrE family metallo-endopeptidase [Muribaculaceae bacterium]MCM1494083.1 ImmA/IrrE family metallo-endopeptidase [Muribaculaceae bacterium]MCM1561346.1 ImmA/IrrE family metallo-endopeptidase [Butyrivibrio sp.]
MIGKDEKTVKVIQEFVEQKRDKENIVNQVIRDDVFALLEKHCIVLYYPLEDDKIEGCHLIKPLCEREEQFVFINTTKAVQEQTWTAAHELGHVWKVDHYVKNQLKRSDFDSEDIVNRFAAELLLPESIFREEIRQRLEEYHYKGSVMSTETMVRLVTYLMNYFCTPYKAVIRRFIELDYIKESSEEAFLQGFQRQEALYRRLRLENQYTRLETINRACSMEMIEQDIKQLEETIYPESMKINRLRELFHLEPTIHEGSDESYQFGEYIWAVK